MVHQCLMWVVAAVAAVLAAVLGIAW
jgi:hypothetical protein